MKRLAILLSLILSFGLVGLMATPHSAAAFDPFGKLKDPNNNVCTSSNEAGQSTICTTDGQANPVSGTDSLILKITNFIALMAGVAAVIVIIVGGLQYILSSGDPSRTNSAKNTILYAVIGLVVIVAARSIIVFVINRL